MPVVATTRIADDRLEPAVRGQHTKYRVLFYAGAVSYGVPVKVEGYVVSLDGKAGSCRTDIFFENISDVRSSQNAASPDFLYVKGARCTALYAWLMYADC